MKKLISGLLAGVAMLSLCTSAIADSDTEKYDSQKGASYSIVAKLMQKQVTLDIIIPNKVEAVITRTYDVNTNDQFDIADKDTGIGNIDSTYLAMSFFSPEYQIVNNSDIPIKVFATLSATVKGKVNLLEDTETDVESDDKKNLRLWLSHSLEEGGSKADRDKESGQRIFDAEKRGDILITKKAPSSASVLFERLGVGEDDNNVGYFRLNGQTKEIPNPYWDSKDGVTIKFILKVTPASDE